LADAIDLISEQGDLVLICGPASATDERIAALGAHADGAILVVSGTDGSPAAVEMADRVAKAGAPVLGVVELADNGRRKRGRR